MISKNIFLTIMLALNSLGHNALYAGSFERRKPFYCLTGMVVGAGLFSLLKYTSIGGISSMSHALNFIGLGAFTGLLYGHFKAVHNNIPQNDNEIQADYDIMKENYDTMKKECDIIREQYRQVCEEYGQLSKDVIETTTFLKTQKPFDEKDFHTNQANKIKFQNLPFTSFIAKQLKKSLE